MQVIWEANGDKSNGLIRHIGKSTSNNPELKAFLMESLTVNSQKCCLDIAWTLSMEATCPFGLLKKVSFCCFPTIASILTINPDAGEMLRRGYYAEMQSSSIPNSGLSIFSNFPNLPCSCVKITGDVRSFRSKIH